MALCKVLLFVLVDAACLRYLFISQPLRHVLSACATCQLDTCVSNVSLACASGIAVRLTTMKALASRSGRALSFPVA